MGRLALVLGAGGHAAIAWETGVLAGMADAGVHVCDADVVRARGNLLDPSVREAAARAGRDQGRRTLPLWV